MDHDDWMKKILAELKGEKVEDPILTPKEEDVGTEKPTPSENEESAETLSGTTGETEDDGDEVVFLNEEDVESGEMFLRQQQYEEELARLPIDHPKNLFPHNYLQTMYLPVVTTSSKRTPVVDYDKAVEDFKNMVYDKTKSGRNKLNHAKFCELWHGRFRYEYAGDVLTPQGAITPQDFKSRIIGMLVNMGTEHSNLDTTTVHLYNTYITAYHVNYVIDRNKIPFKNGDLVLNPDKKSFTFYEGCLSPVPYRFEYNFKNIPNCEEPPFPHFKEWKDGLFGEGDQYSLKQMLGYLLIPSNKAQEAFFIIGKGGSGKSILTDCIITNMLGKAAFPISIGTFFNNPFQMSTSLGKLCVYDDDIGETHLTKTDSGKFKNFITSEMVQLERKFCDPITVNNSARIVCSGNHMISSADKSDGFTRRLHVIYTKPRVIEKVDRQFKQKIKKEIEMIALWALEGLLEIQKNGNVPYVSERTETGLSYYTESQKWEEQFINDCFYYKENTVTYSTDIETQLTAWMKENMEICGEGSVTAKFRAVAKWLQDEGADKNGYVYKRGLRKGDKYTARGYVNMSVRDPKEEPQVFYNEKGNFTIRVNGKKKKEDDVEPKEDV